MGALKKSLIGLTEKQDENGTICDVDDARKKLTLEVEIVNIMKKLGLETVRDLPTGLLRCYLYSKVLQIQGVSLTYCPTTYRKAAYDEARILGDGFVKIIQGLDIKFDEVIGDVIRGVVAERKLQSYSLLSLHLHYRIKKITHIDTNEFVSMCTLKLKIVNINFSLSNLPIYVC